MGKIYCGIDFHKRTSTLCFVDEQGNEVDRITTIATASLVRYLVNKKDLHIGIEATGGVNHVAEQLIANGHKVTILNTNQFKAVGLGGKKTDERDAKAIAQCMRINGISSVYLKSKYARTVKALLVNREQVVRARVNFVNHIRGTLREFGITMPKGMEEFLEQAEAKIKEVDNGYIQKNLNMMFQDIKVLMAQEKEIEESMFEFTKDDERISLLQSIPGIGPMGSLAITAVVDDCERFKDAKHFASYLGLVPKEHSSGDKRRLGSITRSGSEIVRRYLIHGARAVLLHTKKDETDVNRAWAKRLVEKKGMNKATVALAHRLARIAHSILRTKKPYTAYLKTINKGNECKAA
jgi:transposase